jgi:hypothetical protein
MYGLVNAAIEELITTEHGPGIWNQVAGRAEFEGAFVSMETYPDELTFALVAAVCDVTDVKADAFLRKLGGFWVKYTAQRGYGPMFQMWGESLGEFLDNLDLMHGRVQLAMPDLRPPTFSTKWLGKNEVELVYNTHRDGLASMVVGLLEGLAEHFGTSVIVTHVVNRQDAGHDVFHLVLS